MPRPDQRRRQPVVRPGTPSSSSPGQVGLKGSWVRFGQQQTPPRRFHRAPTAMLRARSSSTERVSELPGRGPLCTAGPSGDYGDVRRLLQRRHVPKPEPTIKGIPDPRHAAPGAQDKGLRLRLSGLRSRRPGQAVASGPSARRRSAQVRESGPGIPRRQGPVERRQGGRQATGWSACDRTTVGLGPFT
jgi:hypothetical protein